MNKVFISFKNTDEGIITKDYKIAKQLENLLRKNSIEVFFSEVSLIESAHSEYKEIIDRELDSSSILVLLGTKSNYITSPWVKYEWDNFLQNIISGITPDNEIFCLLSNIKPSEKPLGIRFKQTFEANTDGIISLVNFICSKFNKQAKTFHICKNCGKIFDPREKISCHYHEMSAIYTKVKNFDGEKQFWIFPCCGKQLICNDVNSPPSRADGCIIGKHTI